MVQELLVLDPTTEPETVEVIMAPRPDTLRGKVLGILDNSKPNAGKILEILAKTLTEMFSLSDVVIQRKLIPSRGAPDEILDEMARQCDFIITGVGD